MMEQHSPIGPIRTLVVDDSASMRQVLCSELEADPLIEVVGTASNAFAAREAIKALSPSVMTLDLDMPGMNGLEFLKKVMKLRPMPVLIVSSAVSSQSTVALEALAIGAFDFFEKPKNGTIVGAFDDLRAGVRSASVSDVIERPVLAQRARTSKPFVPNDKIVAVGASTGGVNALISLLSSYPRNCPPTLITQHLPASFTQSIVTRLNHHCLAEVREATNGAPLHKGRVYIAPGGSHHLEIVGRRQLICRLSDGPLRNGHRPSVDVLFKSIARHKVPAVGVIMTGMGDDGAKGLLAMRQAGARTLGQDEETSLVYGMPRVAQEIGAVEKQLPLNKLTAAILKHCSAGASPK